MKSLFLIFTLLFNVSAFADSLFCESKSMQVQIKLIDFDPRRPDFCETSFPNSSSAYSWYTGSMVLSKLDKPDGDLGKHLSGYVFRSEQISADRNKCLMNGSFSGAGNVGAGSIEFTLNADQANKKYWLQVSPRWLFENSGFDMSCSIVEY